MVYDIVLTHISSYWRYLSTNQYEGFLMAILFGGFTHII